MQVIDLKQGSPEWLAHRAKERNASEAPAMMGVGKYQTRSELLKTKATGIAPEIDAGTQHRFDDGHRTEALARAIVEEIIGEELYPVVGVSDDGHLAASFDGVTMDVSTGFEHKLWNDEFAAMVRDGIVPETHVWQLEQQILVGGLEKIIFVCSDGTRDKFEWTEYRAVEGRAEQLLAGWKQFDEDLANYQHTESVPEVVAAPIQGFGSLVLQVEGRVVACNVDDFKAGAQAFLERLPRASELQSDQDFADAELAVKACVEAEDGIKIALDAAMAQAASIDEVFRAARFVSELIRSARLALDKSVRAKKESIRGEICREAHGKLVAHVAGLNARIGGQYIQAPGVSIFADAIKGKRTIASLRDACDTELARAKIATSEIADRIEINYKHIEAQQVLHLFPDFAAICQKSQEDFANMIVVRKTAEENRIEAQREKARQEEADRQREIDAARAQIAEENAKTKAAIVEMLASPEPSVADDGARLKLGEINARLHPLSLTADALKALGFDPVGNQGAAKLYKASDYPSICAAIIRHVQASTTQPRKAA